MPGLASLQNRYFALRHGLSEANARGIIVSDPRRGETAFGLSEAGRAQVLRSLACWRAPVPLVVSSPFLRARQSAEIAHAALRCNAPIRIDARLRERDFGTLEGLGAAHYEAIWDADARDPTHTLRGVESAASVRARALDLVEQLEREHAACCILLVAHGDTLQLLWTAFAGRTASAHRQRTPLLPAQLEEFERS